MSRDARLVMRVAIGKPVEISDDAMDVLEMYLETCQEYSQVHCSFDPDDCRNWVADRFSEDSEEPLEMINGAKELISTIDQMVSQSSFDDFAVEFG